MFIVTGRAKFTQVGVCMLVSQEASTPRFHQALPSPFSYLCCFLIIFIPPLPASLPPQSQGTINSSLFQAFQCQPQGGRFTVDLNLLLECLQVFGAASLANTMLTMSYEVRGGGREGGNLLRLLLLLVAARLTLPSSFPPPQPNQAVLRLTLEEQGVLTTCDIHALEEGEDALDLAALASAFRSSPEVLRAILKSEVLKEAISELSDLPGAGSVRVSVAPHEPHFHLAAGGVYGALEIFLPKSSEVRLLILPD